MGKSFTIRGGKVETEAGFKNASKGGGNDAKYATRLPKEPGTITVRFLAGVTDWVWYDQVWDDAKKVHVVLTEENADNYEDKQPSRRFLTPALDTSQNRVIALEIPKSLAKQVESMIVRKKRPVTEFDVELWKEGSGTDTRYFSEFAGWNDIDLDKYTAKIPNLWEIVEEMVNSQGDGKDQDNDPDDDDLNDTDDEDEAEAEPIKATVKAPARKIKIAKRG